MRKKLKELSNGCSRSEVFISPKNYKSIKTKSQLPKYWFVECRFFDPRFTEKYPNGFQFRKKFSGDNIVELKLTAEVYKKEMEETLDTSNYNPISKVFMNERGSDLHPGLLFLDALQKTYDKINSKYKTENHRKQVRCMIARIKEFQYISRLEFVKISEIRTWHIKNLLDTMNLTNSVYNKFRTYLSGLFKELTQYGCMDTNYIRDISKREENAKVRKVLTTERFDAVFDYMRKKMPEFFRFTAIFHYSGARTSELMRLKRNQVDFENREFTVLVLKGAKQSWETKAIVPAAVPYWESLLKESIYEDEYLFSYFQCPGYTKISGSAITQRWNRHIKKSKDIKDSQGNIIEIDEDFYSLKHLFLEKLDQLQYEESIIDFNLAQSAASHKSNRTTGIYTVGRKNRVIQHLKTLNVK